MKVNLYPPFLSPSFPYSSSYSLSSIFYPLPLFLPFLPLPIHSSPCPSIPFLFLLPILSILFNPVPIFLPHEFRRPFHIFSLPSSTIPPLFLPVPPIPRRRPISSPPSTSIPIPCFDSSLPSYSLPVHLTCLYFFPSSLFVSFPIILPESSPYPHSSTSPLLSYSSSYPLSPFLVLPFSSLPSYSCSDPLSCLQFYRPPSLPSHSYPIFFFIFDPPPRFLPFPRIPLHVHSSPSSYLPSLLLIYLSHLLVPFSLSSN